MKTQIVITLQAVYTVDTEYEEAEYLIEEIIKETGTIYDLCIGPVVVADVVVTAARVRRVKDSE